MATALRKALIGHIAFMLMLYPSSCYAQGIGNGGLEDWQISANYQKPDSFWTSDDVTGWDAVERTTDAHSGQYAAKIKVVAPGIPDSAFGLLMYGQFSWATSRMDGWPFPFKPLTLKFWYKQISAHADTGVAELRLTSDQSPADFPVGTAKVKLPPTSVWTLKEVPIVYTIPYAPDTMRILFQPATNDRFHVGTELYIDDIEVDYTNGIGAANVPQPAIYPNPAVTQFHIQLPEVFDVSVVDLAGRTVTTISNNSGRCTIDCSNWPNGLYLVYISSERTSGSASLIKYR